MLIQYTIQPGVKHSQTMEWTFHKSARPFTYMRKLCGGYIMLFDIEYQHSSLVDAKGEAVDIPDRTGIFATSCPGIEEPFILGATQHDGGESTSFTKFNMNGRMVSAHRLPYKVMSMKITPGMLRLVTTRGVVWCDHWFARWYEVGVRHLYTSISHDCEKAVEVERRNGKTALVLYIIDGREIAIKHIPNSRNSLYAGFLEWSTCSKYIVAACFNKIAVHSGSTGKLIGKHEDVKRRDGRGGRERDVHFDCLVPTDTEFSHSGPPRLICSSDEETGVMHVYKINGSPYRQTAFGKSSKPIWLTHNVWISRRGDGTLIAHSLRRWTPRWWADIGSRPSAKVLAMARCLGGDLMADVMAVVVCLT
jgi:hypothetical protein